MVDLLLQCSSPEPKYTMIREPVEGEIPEYLVMEIQLPGIVSGCSHYQSCSIYFACAVLIVTKIPPMKLYQVFLLLQKSSRNLCLEVGEDRVVLKTRPSLFFLDVDLPFLVDNETVGAQYNTETNLLTLTLSVTAKAPL